MKPERRALIKKLAAKLPSAVGIAEAADSESGPGEKPGDCGQVGRILRRLGIIPQSVRGRNIEEEMEKVAAELSEVAGARIDARQVMEMLIPYAAGPQAPCAAQPQCLSCDLSEQCNRFNKRPSLKEIPEDERPRERLLKCGADALSEAELLAIIIRDGTPEMSAVGLAHALLARFGSLRNLSRAGAPEITKVKGIGKAKAAQILAALAVGRRASSETARTGDLFDSPERVFDYFRAGFRDLKQETFHVVLLDTKHRLLKTSRIFAGTLNLSTVHPREIFNEAIRESAAAVIFVHNHPSGDPTPSREDIALTKRLKEVGELVGIKALDHVIIGGDGFTSLASLGIV